MVVDAYAKGIAYTFTAGSAVWVAGGASWLL